MIKYLLLLITSLSLAGCGQSGDLYLTKGYTDRHATQEQKVPPSDSLKNLDENQRILHDT